MSNHHVAKSQAEMAELFSQDLTTGVGRSIKHDSADKHVSGEAVYIDDRLEFPNQLHVYARTADRAHARILRIDTTPCYAFEGVRIAITHEDIPGLKDIGPVVAGDPLLAIDKVEFFGQPVLAVAARDLTPHAAPPWRRSSSTKTSNRCWTWSRPCAKAFRAGQSHPPARRLGQRPGHRPHRLQGTLHIGGQEHFYLKPRFPR